MVRGIGKMEYWNNGIVGRTGCSGKISAFRCSNIPLLPSLIVCLAGLLAAAGGCHGKEGGRGDSLELKPPAELGATIGSLAEVVPPVPVVVEGYGLIGGLPGTGSGYCPPEVRAYLRQYIPTQLPAEHVNVDALLDSKNSAVVALEGVIPAMPSMGERFDVRVSLLPGSEATSIQSGWLYKAELLLKGTFGARTRPVATVEGPVFVNPIGTAQIDPRSGYLLGGAKMQNEYVATLRLRTSSFRTVSLIRNRLSERYGPSVAEAVSAGTIQVRIPAEYRQRKARFQAMIPATFLEATNELTGARVDTFVQMLASSRNKEACEVALEAVGRASAAKLTTLLNSPDPEVRLRAGRCMLNVGDKRGLPALRDLALDPKSPQRREAIEAIMISPLRTDAVMLGQRLLRDEDVAIVLVAYNHLREIDDRFVSREVVGRGFLLEQVVQSSHQAIFVSRSGDPRIVLFGGPLSCRDNLFVESPDQTVMLNARAGQDYVSITRKHPTRPGIIGPVQCRRNVADVVRALGGELTPATTGPIQHLGVPYSQVVAVLEQMCAKGAVTAQFWPGPLPKIEPPVKN